MRFADQLTYDELCRLFPESEFVEAAGVLEVINQTPEQNQLYSSRLKVLLDEASRLESTRIEALKEGVKEGLLKGRIEMIQTLQRLLNTPESTTEESRLSSFPTDTLKIVKTPPWSTYALKSGSPQPSPVSASAKSGLIPPSRQKSPMPTLARM
jgi:hypothetical protein